MMMAVDGPAASSGTQKRNGRLLATLRPTHHLGDDLSWPVSSETWPSSLMLKAERIEYNWDKREEPAAESSAPATFFRLQQQQQGHLAITRSAGPVV